MNFGKGLSPTESDFWLNIDSYSTYLVPPLSPHEMEGQEHVFSIDMIRLASIRRAISNFVKILACKTIPIHFNDENQAPGFGGEKIFLSSHILSKADFDVTVGQALHEASHIMETDYDIVKYSWANIPPHILKLSDSKGIRRDSIEKFIYVMWHVIEDRYIDNYIFNEAVGYRGYYAALYDRFWNSKKVEEILVDPDLFRYPSLDSYGFRITNFTNKKTDLLALPRLDEIAKLIDLTNISRLKTTKDRVKLTFEVTEVVLNCIDNPENPSPVSNPNGQSKNKQNKLADPNDYFCDEEDFQEVDVSKKQIEEVSEILTMSDGEQIKPPKENRKAVHQISDENIDEETRRSIEEVVESQRQFLFGELPKSTLNEKEKAVLDLVDKNGMVMVQIEVPNGDNNTKLKVNCIIVQNMSKDLIFSGNDIFPLCKVEKIGAIAVPDTDNHKAVLDGIRLGTKLGKRLQIRTESNIDKLIRKKTGKLMRRQLHEAAFDAEDLFYKIQTNKYNDVVLHISVDASSSMEGEKWQKTMTAVVAICKAASMISNIHVTVSFRCTQEPSIKSSLPYIVLAYDSKKDKFSKIKQTFPYLSPNGCTPEGLAFSATMKMFENISPEEEDRYFLNFSDGQPYYHYDVSELHNGKGCYTGIPAARHTKKQVDMIRSFGVKILSYFISSGPLMSDSCEEAFKLMYGEDAKFIDVENVIPLAQTMNEFFLSGQLEKKS